MNNQLKYQKDLLKQYIDPEGAAKAPEGFTSNVMTRIQLETAHSAAFSVSGRRNLVPLISAAVTILLIVVALFIPGNQSDALTLIAINTFNNVKSVLPDLNLTSFFSISLPSVMLYVFIGILLLTFFDRALYGIFHRGKQ